MYRQYSRYTPLSALSTFRETCMFTEMKKRKYTLKQRATQQEETRARIVEATVELHQEVGPRDTTISAVAERAGVGRLTVYRHFPDDASLLAACSSHYMAQHVPPDPATWQAVENPRERTRAALARLYAYYREVDAMFSQVLRDAEHMPVVRATTEDFITYLEAVREDLLAHWQASRAKKEALAVTLRHVLEFWTWQSLSKAGLDDAQATELVLDWVETAASGTTRT